MARQMKRERIVSMNFKLVLLTVVVPFGTFAFSIFSFSGNLPLNVASSRSVRVETSFSEPFLQRSIKNDRNGVSSLKMPLMGSGMSEDPEPAVIRSIDKEMEKYSKKKDQVLANLNTVTEKLQILQKKKQEYLDGMQLGKVPEGRNFSETTARSAVKAFGWRVIAGTVTLITSLQFSKSLRAALSIVGSDFFSKAATMFIGERLMNRSQAGRKGGADDVGRSLAKALIWRLFAICNTLTIAFFVAKDLKMASKIAGSDAFFKTFLMFVYERVWARIEWGKEYIIDFYI